MVNVIRKVSITIIGNKDLLYELYDHVKQYIYKPEAKKCEYTGHGNLHVILDDNESSGYHYLMEMSEKFQLHPHIAQWVRYTKAEEESAKFYVMGISTPLELEGTKASDYGTQYGGGCPYCGLGGKPVSDVLVDRKFMKKYKIGTLYPDIYVSEEIKELIESNNLTGVSFDHEVKDYKGREMSRFLTFDIHHVLPSMRDSVWLIKDEYSDRRYDACGHSVVYLRSDIQYEKEKLDEAQDFNLTNEYVDNFRLRQIIVSARVRKLFKQNKVYSAFFPIAIL